MVNALGVSNAPFNPHRAGRLCRGRERWIEPWDPESPDVPVEVQRLVVSGAAFSDLSAQDALRGIPHSGVDFASLISTLFPRKKLLAFMEDGHPADIPDDAEGVELYEGHRAGGRSAEAFVRWYLPMSGVKQIRALLKQDLRGFAVLEPDSDPAELFEALFPLVGMATLDSPPARFQPAALPDLVTQVKALILVHRDKHGPAMGIYTAERLETGTKLEGLCKKADALLVPFAIPPMLARWDRALSELRDGWTEETPFPVPEPEGGYDWEARSRRRRGRRERREDTAGKAATAPKTDLEEESGDNNPPEADAAKAEKPEKAPRKRKRSSDKESPKVPDVDLLDDDLLLIAED